MSSRINNEFPVVTKTITLDAAERARLNRMMSISARLKTSIIDMMIEAHTKIADRENGMWNELATRFGYKDMDALLDEDKNLEISWASSTINLRSRQ